MKVNDVRVNMLFAGAQLDVMIPKEYAAELYETVRAVGAIDAEADYEIIIRKKRKPKTLDQNAYAWELIGKLARKLRRSPTEVYREIIRDMPAYVIVPVADRAVDRFVETWTAHGVGWVCEDLGACRRAAGYRNIKCHYGSSTFKRDEMSQFIDTIVEECHEQGISTMTPREIAALGVIENA